MRKSVSVRTLAMLTRSVHVAGVAMVLAGVAACYNPHVNPGGLHCAPSGKACPDGFECGAGNLCFEIGSVGSGGGPGSGGATGSGGKLGSGGAPGTGGTNVQPRRKVGQTCLIRNEGQPDQSDDCESGALCMTDCQNARCYKICDKDDDCEQSACTRAAPGGTPLLCDVPFVSCNPVDTTATSCQGFGCFLLSAEPTPAGGDRTVCDCGMGAAGAGEPCSESRTCFPGLLCPAGTRPGAGYCRRVCDPTSGCSSGGTCHPFGPTWGYCF